MEYCYPVIIKEDMNSVGMWIPDLNIRVNGLTYAECEAQIYNMIRTIKDSLGYLPDNSKLKLNTDEKIIITFIGGVI